MVGSGHIVFHPWCERIWYGVTGVNSNPGMMTDGEDSLVASESVGVSEERTMCADKEDSTSSQGK